MFFKKLKKKTKTQAVEKKIGAVEHISLPDFGIKHLAVRVDTGAILSALHAENIRIRKVDGKKHVFFDIAIGDKNDLTFVPAKAPLKEVKKFTSSNGHTTKRPVIITRIKLGKKSWQARVSLIDRSKMNYRMLLGRNSLRHKFIVDVGQRFIVS